MGGQNTVEALWKSECYDKTGRAGQFCRLAAGRARGGEGDGGGQLRMFLMISSTVSRNFLSLAIILSIWLTA